MTRPFAIQEKDKLTFDPEISPSMVYRELERYHIETIYDPLCSTSESAGYFKLQNVRVIGNDLALYTYVKGKGLWENNLFTIPEWIAERMTDAKADLPEPYHYATLGGEWLDDGERAWLEYWRKVVNEAKDEYVRALAETAVCLVIDYWITCRAHPALGTPSEWSPPALLRFYINHVNRNVLDNEESNEMWRTDPIELTSKVVADVLFINPPPLKGYASFGAREQTLESWLRGMSKFPLRRVAPEGAIGGSFDGVTGYLRALSRLLQAAEHIPIWAFALSNRQPFTRPEFEELLRSVGRSAREIDLGIARQFFSRRAVDTIIIAVK